MSYYPIFLELKGRRCLVIGGGAVSEGKVAGLMAAEAAVTVVSPSLSLPLAEQLAEGQLTWIERDYQDGDIEGFDLCFVATDDGSVNAEARAEGQRIGVLVNAADDPANCDFILPSVVRQGKVVVAASTGGASPALARRLREELTAFLSEDYAELATMLEDVRREVRSAGISIDGETWQRAIDPRTRALVAQRRVDAAKQRFLENLGVKSASESDGSDNPDIRE